MNQILIAVGALLLGCTLRTLLPYLVKGFQDLQENKPWPAFEYSYLGSLGLAVTAYVVLYLTTPDLFSQVVAMPFIEIVALSYFGQDASRLLIKFSQVVLRFAQI